MTTIAEDADRICELLNQLITAKGKERAKLSSEAFILAAGIRGSASALYQCAEVEKAVGGDEWLPSVIQKIAGDYPHE